MRRRIVVTGMGAWSSAGTNLEQARKNFVGGICCLSPIDDPRVAHLKARYAGLLQGFDPEAADRGALRADHPGRLSDHR